MRKIFLLLTTLVIVSMLMTACAEEGTATGAPATDAPELTEEPTMEVTEEPAGTETVEPTQEGTPVGGIPVTGEEDPSRLSNQLDYDVWNGEGEQIGEVDDMVVELNDARVSYVIVGTGGFLEIGEKEVLIPWDSLKLQTEGGDMTGDDRFAFILQADQQMFENSPDWDVNALLPPLGEPADNWDVDVRTYWESGVVPSTPAPDATAVPEATATIGTDATATPSDGANVEELQGVILATELLGTAINIGMDGTLVDNQGPLPVQGTPVPPGTAVATGMSEMTATPSTGLVNPGEVMDGTIDDILVDVNSGDILYVVITATLEDGERWIPVPLNQFRWDADNGAFVLDAAPAMLREAPFFENGEYPDTTADGWDTEFSTFWQ